MVELALGGVDNFIFVQMQLDTESELNCGGGCSKKVFKGEEITPLGYKPLNHFKMIDWFEGGGVEVQ